LAGFEVLDARVPSGEEEAFVAVIAPPYDVWRRPFFPVDFQDLGVPVGFADVMALDHDSITDTRSHLLSHASLLFGHATETDTSSVTALTCNRRDVSVLVPGTLVPCSPGCDLGARRTATARTFVDAHLRLLKFKGFCPYPAVARCRTTKPCSDGST